ncbi:MAG: helix-turn-helix domain-containing protein, partial [Rhizobiaceae bacterium]
MVGGRVFSGGGENERSEGSGRVATNMRACFILEAVAGNPDGLTPTEVSRTLNLPKQTVHRVCRSLVEQGFLT